MSNNIAPDKPRTTGAELRDEFLQEGIAAHQVAHKRLQELRERAGHAVESSREKVRENPLISLLVAAGVGVAIGMLVSRRRSE